MLTWHEYKFVQLKKVRQTSDHWTFLILFNLEGKSDRPHSEKASISLVVCAMVCVDERSRLQEQQWRDQWRRRDIKWLRQFCRRWPSIYCHRMESLEGFWWLRWFAFDDSMKYRLIRGVWGFINFVWQILCQSRHMYCLLQYIQWNLLVFLGNTYGGMLVEFAQW